jgi:hypothetical protein
VLIDDEYGYLLLFHTYRLASGVRARIRALVPTDGGHPACFRPSRII